MTKHNTAGVYAIHCTFNGRRYIGSSSNIGRRWAQHRRELGQGLHRNPELQEAWEQHGRAGFSVVLLVEGGERREEQRQIVEHLRQGCNLYNVRSALGESVTTNEELRAAMESW